eukprot:364743-Chlamydomonas_euryale.AAC.84
MAVCESYTVFQHVSMLTSSSDTLADALHYWCQTPSQSYRERSHEGYACVERSKTEGFKQRAGRHKGSARRSGPAPAHTCAANQDMRSGFRAATAHTCAANQDMRSGFRAATALSRHVARDLPTTPPSPTSPSANNNASLVLTGIADSGDLDSPLYGDSEAAAGRSLQPLLPQRRWLRTEYQTLRRLPRTKAALFTVRTFTEPLSALAGAPAAAAAIAASLRGMSPPMQAYKGLGDLNALADMLEYLDTMANNQNVTKGRKEPRSAAL